METHIGTRGVLSRVPPVSEPSYFLTLAHTYCPTHHVMASRSQHVALATPETRSAFLLRDHTDKKAATSQVVNLKPFCCSNNPPVFGNLGLPFDSYRVFVSNKDTGLIALGARSYVSRHLETTNSIIAVDDAFDYLTFEVKGVGVGAVGDYQMVLTSSHDQQGTMG